MSVPLTVPAIDRVLVALEPEEAGAPTAAGTATGATGGRPIPSAERTVMAAEVLASWFGASLQFVSTDAASTGQLDHLSGTIGLRTDPVLVLPAASFARDLYDHAARCAPSLVVAPASPAARAAAAALGRQPAYLVPPGPKRRQPSGPLLVAPTGGDDLDDALALATVWAQALASPLTLLVPDTTTARAEAERARVRLEAMGLRVTVTPGADPGAAFRDNDATDAAPLALVVSARDLAASPLVSEVLAAGGSVLVAPVTGTGSERPARAGLEAVHDLTAALGGASHDAGGLSPEESAEVLVAAVVGRLGYVDHGWPVVVPVNFSLHEGDIFIRSVRGGKLEAAARNDRVCLEADTISASDRQGSSVIVHGHLEVIADPAVLRAAWANDPLPWVDDDQFLWLRLVPLAITGRRVG